MGNIELQILFSVLSLFGLFVGGVISAYLPKLKSAVDKHLTVKEATIFNHVVDGLGIIANAVVQQFNQTVVADAKGKGAFDVKLADQIKLDAVAAVKSQGGGLLKLGEDVLSDVDGLVSSLIEQAVVHTKLDSAK